MPCWPRYAKYVVVWRGMHNPRGAYQNQPSGMAAGATQCRFTAG
jgi:hypothetical protein